MATTKKAVRRTPTRTAGKTATRRTTAKKASTGRIRAKGSRSDYARRVDEGVAQEIDEAVAAGAGIREQILAKIADGFDRTGPLRRR
jgi:hypothetical protein